MSEVNLIPPPPSPHSCVDGFPSTDLYWTEGVVISGAPVRHIQNEQRRRLEAGEPEARLARDAPQGTIARCKTCGAWWAVAVIPSGYRNVMDTVEWRPVSSLPWRDRDIKKRIQEAERNG